MKKKKFLTLLFLLVAIIGFSQSNNPYDNPNDWTVDIIDDFNSGTFPDTTKWFIEHNCTGTHEWHKKSNIKIENGCLVLSGIKNDIGVINGDTCYCSEDDTIKYFSGAEISTGSYEGPDDTLGNFKYGFFEAYCKLPRGGPFTAFWLSIKNGKYTYKVHPPEIDIFEITNIGTKIDRNAGRLSKNDRDTAWGYNPPIEIEDTSTFYDDWYKFGLLWTPVKVEWYVDEKLVHEEDVEITESLRIMFSYQVGTQPKLVNVDEDFLINYVKYYSPDTEFTDPKRWGYAYNNNHNKDGKDCFSYQWQITAMDKFFSGDFTADGSDELLIVHPIYGDNDSIALLSYVDSAKTTNSSSQWYRDYFQNNGKFNTEWHLGPDDKFTVGNFSDEDGDEVLLTGVLGYANMFTYDNATSTWDRLFTNGGNSKIGTDPNAWDMNSTDKYIVANFDSSNIYDELLCISTSGYAKLYSFDDNTSNWVKLWGAGNPPTSIGTWSLDSDDKYYVGDFDGDEVDELLCISDSYVAELLEFDDNDTIWTSDWDNRDTSNGKIGTWNLGSGDQFYPGDWDDDEDDDLLCISGSGLYTSIQDYSGQRWSSDFGNGGDGYFHDWSIKSSDKFLTGDFIDDGFCDANAQLLMVRGSQDFIDIAYEGDFVKWRTALMYSSECNFVNTVHAKSATIPVSIDDNTLGTRSSIIYPNPSKNGIYHVKSDSATSIDVYNLEGKKIVSKMVSPMGEINISSAPTGIYIFKIKSAFGITAEKVIYQ